MNRYIITEIDKKTGQEYHLSPEFVNQADAETFVQKVKNINVSEYIPDSNERIDSTFRIYKMPNKELIKEL